MKAPAPGFAMKAPAPGFAMKATAADCAGLEVLGELPPEHLARIAAQCRCVTFGADETILQRGAGNSDVHFVVDGRVNLYFDAAMQSPPIEMGRGRMFGEMSVIDDLPVSAFIAAGEQCRILLLPAQVFWSEVVTAPGVARAIMRSLTARLRSDTAALMQIMHDRIRHEALQRELLLARDIQMGMLRRANPWFGDRADFAIAARIAPARLVGGDFYDAFLLDAEHLVLAIGDAAGKGVSAALFVMRVLTLLRSTAVHWISLADTVQDVNRALASDNEASMFLTLFMAVLDLRTGALDYVNFGHTPPLIRAPDGAVAYHPVAPGVIFGLLEDARGAAGSLALERGSTLLLYSDGVTEAMDQNNRPFGMLGLLETAAAMEAQQPQAIVDLIAATVSDYAGSVEQADDITILAMTFNGSAAA